MAGPFLLSFLLAAQQPPMVAPLVEYGCQWGSGADAGLHVLTQASAPGRFAPAGHAGDPIICRRSSIIPAPEDWEVGASGRILYLVEGTQGADGRMAELDFVGGEFAYTLLSGSYSGDEEANVSARLEDFRGAVQHGRLPK